MSAVQPFRSHWAILGLFCIGTHSAMISIEPFSMPEVPKPATTLPPINMLEEFATPQIREPISKMMKKVRNVHYIQQPVSRESRNGGKVAYFGLELHIYLSGKWLKDCAASQSVSRTGFVPKARIHVPAQLICRSVPSNVGQGIEFIGDARDSCDDNGPIEKHEKGNESHGDQDGEQLEAVSPLGL